MKVILFANNRVGHEILLHMKNRSDLVGLVVHGDSRGKYVKEITQTSGLEAAHIFQAEQLERPDVLKRIKALGADLGFCAFLGTILREPLLSMFPKGLFNIHPSFLPHNRGHSPNVWSIVEETPAGASIHQMTARVDAGGVLCQKRVSVEPYDTGKSLYEKLEIACIDLFKQNWTAIESSSLKPVKQIEVDGTLHRKIDMERVREINLNKMYKAKDLINVLRALTFAPYPGAYFEVNGRKVFLNLTLTTDDEMESQQGEV